MKIEEFWCCVKKTSMYWVAEIATEVDTEALGRKTSFPQRFKAPVLAV